MIRTGSRRRGAAARVAMFCAEAVLVGLLYITRAIPIGPLTRFADWFGRTAGPLHPRSKIGLANLAHAYPEKSEAERRAILTAMWGNLCRLGVEYLQIDRVWDQDPLVRALDPARVKGMETFIRLRDDGKAGILFTAHLGNWELLQIGASRFGLDTAALYRPPNVGLIADMLERARQRVMHSMVESRPGAAYDLASVLERGGHIGLLVDQKFTRHNRVIVNFFGRPAGASPLIAQLARRFECPVHGARSIRLSGGGFRLEITDEIVLPRDGDGAIDVAGATARVAEIVEGWVREYPEQWLWIHRRWDM